MRQLKGQNAVKRYAQQSFHAGRLYWRGGLVSMVIAIAAAFLSNQYGAPIMLFALLIGLSLGFLAEQDRLQPGLAFSAQQALRLGVGLLGIQLSFDEALSFGAIPVVGSILLVFLTLGLGVLLSFANGRRFAYGVLSGGVVAVCGASAALAFSAVLPRHPKRDEDTALVVIGVTVLSTIAMIFYPFIATALRFTDQQTGFLIGASIHDVAQVVGAGYSVSEEAGLIATLVKMIRVACLPLLVILVHLAFQNGSKAKANVPWFLVLFVLLVLVRSVFPIAPSLIEVAGQISSWLLVVAIASLGVKTNLQTVLRVHPALLLILLVETVFILLGSMIFASFL